MTLKEFISPPNTQPDSDDMHDPRGPTIERTPGNVTVHTDDDGTETHVDEEGNITYRDQPGRG